MRPDGLPNEDTARFDSWLDETLSGISGAERSARLLKWDQAPAARLAHPQEDHLVPLHVVVGAAEQEAGQRIYHQVDFFGGITLSSYQFG